MRFAGMVRAASHVLRMAVPRSILLLLVLFGGAVWANATFAGDFDTRAKQAILVDMSTGQVLYEKNPDQPVAPSSMAKLMTLYLLFEALKSGAVTLDDRLPVSIKATRVRGSRMYVKANTEVRLEDILRGIVVQSGNDASIVVAEALAGDEKAFADLMNKKGKALGLKNSQFTNATGHADSDMYMTVRDIAYLSRRLIEDFPEYYHYFSETTFQYGRAKPQGNRNPLLFKPQLGADGLKTGQTRAGGYGLAASAKQKDRRLILVVNGLNSVRSRASESQRLLKWGFRSFANYALYKAGETVEAAEVWLGRRDSVPLATAADITVALPRDSRSSMKVVAVYEGPLIAPIRMGDQVAKLRVSTPGRAAVEYPLVAAMDVPRAGFFGRVLANLQRVIEDIFR